jgi:hypothetical protein
MTHVVNGAVFAPLGGRMKKVLKLIAFAFMFLSQGKALANGGASGGGGDLDPDKKPEPVAVKKFIDENQKIVVPAILNWTGASSISGLPKDKFRARLFPMGLSTIVDMALKTPVTAEVGRICIDPETGEQKDGAVLADGSICIDPVRVADKTTEATYRLKSLALIGHELSHKMGPKPKTKEERTEREYEAKRLELLIMLSTQPDIDAYQLDIRKKFLKQHLENVKANTNSVSQLLEVQGTDEFLCLFLGLYGTSFGSLSNFEGSLRITGASPVRFQALPVVAELQIRGNNLLNYCVSDSIVPGTRKEIDPKFEGKNEIPVNMMAQKRIWAGVTSTRPIRNVQFKDKTDLVQELLYVKVLLGKFEKESGL